jgi:hypothetical protein
MVMLRSPIGPLRKIFGQQRRELTRYEFPKRVEGRNSDGTIGVRPLNGECIERSNICSAYPGMIIQVPCGNGLSNLGAAGTAMARVNRLADTMWVESIDPPLFPRGTSFTATITGRGFTTSSVFDFLVPGTKQINEGVVVDGSHFVSPTGFEVELSVAFDAALILDQSGDIAFDNQGAHSMDGFTKLARNKQGVYGIVEGPPAFTALFFGHEGDGLRGWAYRYAGGGQGALIDLQDFPDMGSVASMAVVTYSPLRVAIQAGGGPLYLWDIGSGTLVTNTDHDGSDWYFLCSGGDGYAYWIEHLAAAPPAYHAFKLWRINAAGAVSQVAQASNNLDADIGLYSAGFPATFVDGSYAYHVVAGASAGIVQIPLAGGDKPRYRAGGGWLPGDHLTDWTGWFPGGRIPGQARALAYNLNTSTFARLRVSALRGHTGGDPLLFASEPLVDPTSLAIVGATPGASGSAYALVTYDGTTARVALVPTVQTEESEIQFYDLDPGPGFGYPFLMVPV